MVEHPYYWCKIKNLKMSFSISWLYVISNALVVNFRKHIDSLCLSALLYKALRHKLSICFLKFTTLPIIIPILCIFNSNRSEVKYFIKAVFLSILFPENHKLKFIFVCLPITCDRDLFRKIHIF